MKRHRHVYVRKEIRDPMEMFGMGAAPYVYYACKTCGRYKPTARTRKVVADDKD